MNEPFKAGSDLSVHFGGGSGAVQAGDGAYLTGVAGRRTVNTERQRAAAVVTEATETEGNLSVDRTGHIVPGLIGGFMPTIGGTALSGAYTPLSLTGSGTEHVICTLASTLTNPSGVFVTGLTITGAAFSIGSDPGPSGLVSSTGAFTLLFATFVDGVRTFQTTPGDWSVDVIDSRAGDGACTLVRI